MLYPKKGFATLSSSWVGTNGLPPFFCSFSLAFGKAKGLCTTKKRKKKRQNTTQASAAWVTLKRQKDSLQMSVTTISF